MDGSFSMCWPSPSENISLATGPKGCHLGKLLGPQESLRRSVQEKGSVWIQRRNAAFLRFIHAFGLSSALSWRVEAWKFWSHEAFNKLGEFFSSQLRGLNWGPAIWSAWMPRSQGCWHRWRDVMQAWKSCGCLKGMAMAVGGYYLCSFGECQGRKDLCALFATSVCAFWGLNS